MRGRDERLVGFDLGHISFQREPNDARDDFLRCLALTVSSSMATMFQDNDRETPVNDEETPLLRPQRQANRTQRTHLPWFQFSLVLFLELAEPLTSHVIYPFAPQVFDLSSLVGSTEKR